MASINKDLGGGCTVKYNNCPLCSSTEKRKMDVPSAILDLPGNSESSVVLCSDCGAYYLWPYISEELLSELYSKSYFTGISESDSKLSNVPSSNNDYESDFVAVRLGKFRETVRVLLKLSPNAKSILDIGAATGDFLAIAKEEGFAVTGIELSSYASAKAKKAYGFEFHETGIVKFQGKGKYDLIHMNHVFEHFDFPHQALEKIDSLLNEGGMIYVEVPFQFNVFEVLMYRLKGQKKKFDVFSLHHPMFYRPATLKKIFAEHGFDCKSICVFKWSRYPTIGLKGQIKRLIWLVASLVGQGIMIEAVFERKVLKR